MAEDTASWPFQLEEEKAPAPWPFQLDAPSAPVVDDTPSWKKGWGLLTGQRPLLKTGQSDVQTIKEVLHPVVPHTPDPEAVRQQASSDRPEMPEWYAEKLRNRTLESFEAPPGTPPTTVGPSTPEADRADMDRRSKESKDQALFWMEIIAGLVVSGAMPPTAVPSAMQLLQSGRLMSIARNFGPELLRKMGIAAVPAAVDVVMGAPEKAPETFVSNLAGEYIGGGTGRVVSKVGQRLDRARQSVFGQTDEAAMHSGVIRRLGDEPPLGIASGKYIPKAMDTAGTESMWTSRVRDRYESVTKTLDDELKRIQELHPGGKVTAERDRIAGRVQALGDETLLDAVPQEMRHQLEVLPPKINAELRMGYQDLDAEYFSRSVPWTLNHPVQVSATRAIPRPRPRTIGDLLLDPTLEQSQQIGPESIFGQTIRLLENLENLGPHVSLDTAMDMQRTVSGFLTEAADLAARDPKSLLTQSINDKLRPALGEAQRHINDAIRPYAVSLESAKRNAEGIVARAGVSDAVLEGHLAAGNITGATVDPDVLLAYKLLKQPDFVNFSEAHGLRHEWLAASRLPGHPLIGDSTATRSKGMADVIDGSMRSMTDRMQPQLTTAWRVMDGKYKQQAQLYNSQYISEMSEANLDDLMNGAIRLDRPNDIKALRQALGQTHGGGDMLDQVAQMWLTRRLQMATPGSTGKANIDELLTTLDTMPKQTREALFPTYPIEAIRDTLRQGKDMVTAVDLAVDASDPVALQEVMTRLSPTRRERVQSDVLSGMFKEGGQWDPVNPDYFLKRLLDQKPIKDVLYTPEHYENLVHLAHTQRAMQGMAAEGHRRFSPTVRWLEGGGAVTAVIAALSGHPGKAALGTAAYGLTAKALGFLATNPKMVQLLTEGLTTPVSARRAGEITGMLLGNLRAHGLESEMTEQPAPEAVPAQETLAAPGGKARRTD